MTSKEQTPSTNVRTSLIIVIAAIVVGTGLYVWQANKDANKTIDQTQKVQKTEDDNDNAAKKEDAYKGWKEYNWASQGITLKYPADWFVAADDNMDRLYLKNKDVNLNKEETPEGFQQIWLSADQQEVTATRESDLKNSVSAFRMIDGKVTASSIKANGLTLNTYEYTTVGGPTLEAFWKAKNGKRLMATTSTEVNEAAQKAMVASLKQILATIKQ